MLCTSVVVVPAVVAVIAAFSVGGLRFFGVAMKKLPGRDRD
jgi:hypothetical protein